MICFIVKTVPPEIDGVGEYTYHLAKSLRSGGQDVHIFTSVGQNIAGDELDWIHPVIDVWSSQEIIVKLEAQEKYHGSIWCLQYVPQMYGAYGLPRAILELPALLKSKLSSRVALVIHEHGLDWKPGFKNKVLTFLLRSYTRKLLKDADFVITTCKRYQKSLEAFAGRQSKVTTIPVGANILPETLSDEIKQTLIQKHGLQHTKLLGVFGRLSDFRNALTPVHLLAATKKRGVDTKLLLLGCMKSSNPELFSEIKQSAEKLGVSDNIIVTGELSPKEISHYMQLIDVFLFPQTDGVSTRNTTVMSALAHDLPMITYEPVAGNFDGFDVPEMRYIPRGDEQGFIETTITYIQGNHQKKGEVTQFFQDHFSWHAIRNQYLNAMELSQRQKAEQA